jgi:hypothetical protein
MDWIINGFELVVGGALACLALAIGIGFIVRLSESRYRGPMMGFALAVIVAIVLWLIGVLNHA